MVRARYDLLCDEALCKVQEVIEYLNGFDPKMTMQLMRDTPERGAREPSD